MRPCKASLQLVELSRSETGSMSFLFREMRLRRFQVVVFRGCAIHIAAISSLDVRWRKFPIGRLAIVILNGTDKGFKLAQHVIWHATLAASFALTLRNNRRNYSELREK